MEEILISDLNYIFSKIGRLFKKCKKERFFITGGTGFFGRLFLESLLSADKRLKLGIKISVLSRDPERFLRVAPDLSVNSALEFIPGDITAFKFPKGRYENIIHAATLTDCDADPLKMFEGNISGTRRVLEFARICGNKRFLFTSSGAVYGKHPAGILRIPESYQGAPGLMDLKSAYGQSKRVAEFLCGNYARKFGLNIKIARCFAFLGPYLPLNANFAAGNFVRDALNGGPIRVNSDGTALRSYLYTSDLMVWLWTILFKGKVCKPYNVGSDKRVSIRQLAYTVAKTIKTGVRVEIKKKPGEIKEAEESYIPDVSLAMKELGLKQNISLGQGIRRMMDFYSQNEYSSRL